MKSLWKSNKGTAAVEFALVLPVLLLVVMGIIEFGLLLFTYNSSLNASRDITRRLATNRLLVIDASTEAKKELPAWVKNSATVDVSQTAPTDPTTNEITVDIHFPLTAATPVNYVTQLYSSSTLHSSVTMQQEIAP